MSRYRQTSLNENSSPADVKQALEKRSISPLQAFDIMQSIGRRQEAERIAKLSGRTTAPAPGKPSSASEGVET